MEMVCEEVPEQVVVSDSSGTSCDKKERGDPHLREPHRCSICYSTFTRAAKLKAHIANHTQETKHSVSHSKPTLSVDSMPKTKSKHEHVGDDPGMCSVNTKVPDACDKLAGSFQGAFSLPTTLKDHKPLKYPRDNNCPCSLCNKAFYSLRRLRKHMAKHAEKIPKTVNVSLAEDGRKQGTSHIQYQCPLCEMTYSNPFFLGGHMKSHAKKRPGICVCDVCGETFGDKVALNFHKTTHPCNLCGKYFKDKHGMKIHMISHTLKPHGCSICDKAFRDPAALESHMTTHTGELPYLCSLCHKSFSTSKSMKMHLNQSHAKENEENVPFPCSVCNKIFSNNRLLKVHMIVHRLKSLHCSVCGKLYKQTGFLKRHMEQHHTGKPYTCRICDTSFFHQKKLNTHMSIHRVRRQYKYKNCKRYVSRYAGCLKNGAKSVDEAGSLCFVCGKRYKKRSLKEHIMAMHTNEKEHKCGECSKSYTRPYLLQAHMTIHAGNRQYLCNVCGKTFTWAGCLRLHLTTHTGNRARQCSLCSKNFLNSGQLKRHMVSHR